MRAILSARGRRHDHSVRDSIAELVKEAEDHVAADGGGNPELDRQERALIANILRLRETTADDVMVPRADIVAIPLDTPHADCLAIIRREGHSRMPVYGENLDDIAGMAHIKDIYGYTGAPENFSLQSILRHPLMVAPQMPVLDLLWQMRQARVHLALVVDEYGGIDGLLTIEDLVETITGDIADEHDEPDLPQLIERADGTFDVDARMEISDFEEKLGPTLSEDERDADIDTVGGLVFMLAGRVPARGEVIRHVSGTEFRILDADVRHIRRLRVQPAAPPRACLSGG
jgi:magnesium and cobalt transporter